MSDLVAALLLSQLKKVDGYIENKIRAAHNIDKGLTDVEEITPQRVRPGDRCTYWEFRHGSETDRLDCTPTQFIDAVIAEGIPMSTNLHGVGEGPSLQEPIVHRAEYLWEQPLPIRLSAGKAPGLQAGRAPLWRGADESSRWLLGAAELHGGGHLGHRRGSPQGRGPFS